MHCLRMGPALLYVDIQRVQPPITHDYMMHLLKHALHRKSGFFNIGLNMALNSNGANEWQATSHNVTGFEESL